ncbi:SGNH/GDSL hydrolase family protein [Qipengyuania sp. 6B39]|uniref:SGNH/GDSL hydrolase family protein n=1 Tax=Qipengyuania proteolytica TaxID=2867239 RepID=UPI001C8A69AA|nr:SGNH/GDSL hydrolase family protein [Qipengyuania proteolytica]MBX7495372.1 SGNH/GDSL hydrolase family protein [Qipengyuania proteolytica]
MVKRLRIVTGVVSWVFLGLLVLLLAISAWAIAPFSYAPYHVIRTAEVLVKAPFASRLVIGDSRVQFATPPEGSLFAGYGGATSRHVARVSGLLCRVSDAQVTIALGINDTKPYEHDEAASRAALASIMRACDREKLWIATIWPAEPGVEPGGDAYAPVMTARLNAFIAELAGRRDMTPLPVPALDPGFTYDGVHFVEPVSQDYAARLAFPERVVPAG